MTTHNDHQQKQREITLSVAYFVWLVGGLCGAHRYLLGKTKSGHVMMVLSVIVTIIWLLIAFNTAEDTVATVHIDESFPQGGLMSFISVCVLLFTGGLGFADLVVSPKTALLINIGLPCLIVLLGWWILDAFLLKTMLKQAT